MSDDIDEPDVDISPDVKHGREHFSQGIKSDFGMIVSVML